MRAGAASRWAAGARRPVLLDAAAANAHHPPRESPPPAPRPPAAAAGRVHLSTLAPAACGDHQRRHRDEVGLARLALLIRECAKTAVEHLQVTDRPASHYGRIDQRQLQCSPRELLWSGDIVELTRVI